MSRAEKAARWSESFDETASHLARELHELIAALDRRVPRVEEAGEDAIARDTASLREKAVQRLTALDADSRVASRQASDRSKLIRATSP